ncbi:uncharacterized protein VTP21DRAFT_11633 [Calcarisporiella thermophila]|uniref:uncharacterized protein n=1 Tax=Calcarisporiella thermophila TaxID=911321 RepID=UPI0037446CE7
MSYLLAMPLQSPHATVFQEGMPNMNFFPDSQIAHDPYTAPPPNFASDDFTATQLLTTQWGASNEGQPLVTNGQEPPSSSQVLLDETSPTSSATDSAYPTPIPDYGQAPYYSFPLDDLTSPFAPNGTVADLSSSAKPLPHHPCSNSPPASPLQPSLETGGEDNPSLSAPNPKKRTRTTPEQLAILEHVFAGNPMPNNRLRDELARRLSLPQRSIQIWFQNRRAKIKQMVKRAMTSADKDSRYSPYGLPGYAPSALYPANEADKSGWGGFTPIALEAPMKASLSPMFPRDASGNTFPPTASDHGDLLACDEIIIGKWRRVRLSSDDLLCIVDKTRKWMTWLVQDKANRFKMEFSFASVTSLDLMCQGPLAQMVLRLESAPTFYLERCEAELRDSNADADAATADGAGAQEKAEEQQVAKPEKAWVRCSDFTEAKQASHCLIHILRGPFILLYQQVREIALADEHIGRVTRYGAMFRPEARPLSPSPHPPLTPAYASQPPTPQFHCLAQQHPANALPLRPPFLPEYGNGAGWPVSITEDGFFRSRRSASAPATRLAALQMEASALAAIHDSSLMPKSSLLSQPKSADGDAVGYSQPPESYPMAQQSQLLQELPMGDSSSMRS